MAASSPKDDPDVVPQLIAEHIFTTASATGRPIRTVTKLALAAAITDVTVETQTAGASTLTLPLIDNGWKILRSGFLTPDSEGLLPQVDVNYPEGTDVWWRLAMVEWTDDLTGPNVTATFIHRPVMYLQDDFGPLSVAPGTTTRAQFIKQLADRIPRVLAHRQDPLGNYVLGPGSAASQQILTVIPELNVLQQVAGASSTTDDSTVVDSTTTAAQTVAEDPTRRASKQRSANKQAGIAAGANLTVKSIAITDAQREVASQILDVARQANASAEVSVAIIYAAIGENGLSATNTFQCETQISDTTTEAGWWLQGGPNFPTGGALAIARQNPNYVFWQIANDTERNAVWDSAMRNGTTSNRSLADSYLKEDGASAFEAEARAIVQAYGGGTIPAGGGVSGAPTSDVSQLTRGDSDNPDEDSWTCMERLAQEVNWMVFSDPHPANGLWGNYLYYIDGPTCDQQKPALTLTLSDDAYTWTAATESKQTRIVKQDGVTGIEGTVDNTSTQYQSVQTRKGKVQRPTTVKGAETPTSIVFTMITDVLEICAGNVVLIQNAGPMNGRWIITDTTQNALSDLYCTFTLGPPTAPNPEPAITTTTSTMPGTTSTISSSSTGTGALAGAVTIARQACALQATRHCYTYTEGAGRTNDGNNPTSAPYSYDCAGFVEGCYKAARLPDPCGNTSYTGWSGDVASAGVCVEITQDQMVPGDIGVYGWGNNTKGGSHMNMYVGNGECANMGGAGEPVIESLGNVISEFPGAAWFYHLKNAT